MHRRKLLMVGGAGLATALAGCSSDGGESSNNGGSNSNDSTPEPTDSPEPEGGPIKESMNSPFTVGEGKHSIEYVVTGASTAEAIGSQYSNTEANGIFMLVDLEMENVGDETIDITSRHLKAVNQDGQTYDASTSASIYLESDDRFDKKSISFEQLQPGLSTEGTAVFDVVPGDSYALLVEPAGLFSNATPHYVPLGTA